MLISNILLVGFYVSFIIIFLYCYWAHAIYRKSGTRIGMRATKKYYQEMVEDDPSKKGYEVRKAQVRVSPDGRKATVKFNIFDDSKPPVPVAGAIRTYDLVDLQSKCLSGTVVTRKKTPQYCQEYIDDKNVERMRECFIENTSGVGCIWL